jgi:TonB family protein
MKFRHISLLFTSLATFVSGIAAAPRATEYVPMKVIQTEPVNYPRRATDLGITRGEVHIAIQVDDNGTLADHLVTAYTHPLLAETAVNALKKWKYEPAWVDGTPRGATVELTFQFENRGMVVVNMTVSSYVEIRDIELRPGAYSYGAKKLGQLDRIPTPSKVVQPVFRPEAVQDAEVVTVYFYIDEKGSVRLPAVSRETSEKNNELAAAAVNAVAQWEFEPPLSKGQPVLVAARQDFRFRAR